MQNKTMLTIEHGEVKVTVELPWDADIFQIMEALIGLLRAVGFSEEVIKQGLENR